MGYGGDNSIRITQDSIIKIIRIKRENTNKIIVKEGMKTIEDIV